MRITFIALVIAALGIAAAQAMPASASPNAKECPAGVTLTASASGRTVTVGVSPAVNLKPAKDGDVVYICTESSLEVQVKDISPSLQNVISVNPLPLGMVVCSDQSAVL